MDPRVIKYFEDSLQDAERSALLKEAQEDNDLKDQMISCRQLSSLMLLSRDNIDRASGEDSYERMMRNRKVSPFPLRTMRRALGYAAVVALAIVGFWWFSRQDGRRATVDGVETLLSVSSDAGLTTRISLPDGSMVWLNANSTLTYPAKFVGERRVSLEGEAYFEVKHNDRLPFIVSTGKLDVKVLGTRFDVFNYKRRNLSVSLLEGSVCAYSPEDPEVLTVLEPGEMLSEGPDGYSIQAIESNPSTWVDGYYTFDDCSMEQILSKLECYYDVNFSVKDSSLLQYRFTGKFSQSDNVLDILGVLQKVYPFAVATNGGSRRIILGQ